MQTPHESEQNPNRLKSKARTLIINTILSDSLNFLMTFISKLINVFFTVLIARSVTKSSYGLATIYFSFIYIIITMFPSEVLRKTTSQYSHDKNEENENISEEETAAEEKPEKKDPKNGKFGFLFKEITFGKKKKDGESEE